MKKQRKASKRRKKAQDRYKNLSEEEKEKKGQYHRDRNKNLSEEEKQEKAEYMRNYYVARKKYFFGFYKVDKGNSIKEIDDSLGQILGF